MDYLLNVGPVVLYLVIGSVVLGALDDKHQLPRVVTRSLTVLVLAWLLWPLMMIRAGGRWVTTLIRRRRPVL